MSLSPKHALAVASIAGLLFVAGPAAAQSATGNGTAEILAALTLAENQQLDFGRVATGVSPGNVVITQAGAQTCPSTACSNGLAAEFGVTGQAGETVTITADASFQLTGPGANMTVTVDAPPTMDIDNATFNVGGTMAMNNNQAAGVYTGTYAISIAYQ